MNLPLFLYSDKARHLAQEAKDHHQLSIPCSVFAVLPLCYAVANMAAKCGKTNHRSSQNILIVLTNKKKNSLAYQARYRYNANVNSMQRQNLIRYSTEN